MTGDLDAVLADALSRLAAAVDARHGAFRTPCLATRGPDARPRLRTVVLRRLDPEARVLEFHTDRRAAKVAEIAADPRVALHVWDPEAQVQLRLDGVAVAHGADVVADAAWAALHVGSRAPYAIGPTPGSPVATPPPMPCDPDAGRGDFLAVTVALEALEWLELSRDGQRRARFRFTPGGTEATWLVP